VNGGEKGGGPAAGHELADDLVSDRAADLIRAPARGEKGGGKKESPSARVALRASTLSVQS